MGKKFSITAGEEFQLTVGKSSLLLKEDGTIELRGVKILVDGKELVDLDGERIDLN